MEKITFETKLLKIKDWTILRLPESVSEKLPSRGMTMVEGSINDIPFKTLLEPDGIYGPGKKPSHWFRPDKNLLNIAHAKAGENVKVELEPTKNGLNLKFQMTLKTL